MKHLLTAIAIITIFTSQSCNSGTASENKMDSTNLFTRKKSDTVLTFAFVVADVDKLLVQPIHLMRVIKDTFAITKIDTVGSTMVAFQNWRRDTFYFYPSAEVVKKNGVVLKDSKGKDSMIPIFRGMPNALVLQDFNRRYK